MRVVHVVNDVALFMHKVTFPCLWCPKVSSWMLLWGHESRAPRKMEKGSLGTAFLGWELPASVSPPVTWTPVLGRPHGSEGHYI